MLASCWSRALCDHCWRAHLQFYQHSAQQWNSAPFLMNGTDADEYVAMMTTERGVRARVVRVLAALLRCQDAA